MNRILAANPSLLQHILQVQHAPQAYRPFACPHCGLACPWLHGVYLRNADRSDTADASFNPVQVWRFICRGCRRSCSRLPLAIAPRRWYDWDSQQRVLVWLLSELSLHQARARACLDRRTKSRCGGGRVRWRGSRTAPKDRDVAPEMIDSKSTEQSISIWEEGKLVMKPGQPPKWSNNVNHKPSFIVSEPLKPRNKPGEGGKSSGCEHRAGQTLPK